MRLTDAQVERQTGKKAAKLVLVLVDDRLWLRADEPGYWEATDEPADANPLPALQQRLLDL